MSTPTLQQRLATYLKKYPGEKFAKGDIETLAKVKTGVTGETVGRRLRVLHEATCMPSAASKTIEHIQAVQLADGGKFRVTHGDKNHCWYWYEPPQSKQVREVVIEGGVAREIVKTISI
jgi:hypothetical protein